MRRSHVRRWIIKQDIARSVAKTERHKDNVLRRLAIEFQGGSQAYVSRKLAKASIDLMEADCESLLSGFSHPFTQWGPSGSTPAEDMRAYMESVKNGIPKPEPMTFICGQRMNEFLESGTEDAQEALDVLRRFGFASTECTQPAKAASVLQSWIQKRQEMGSPFDRRPLSLSEAAELVAK